MTTISGPMKYQSRRLLISIRVLISISLRVRESDDCTYIIQSAYIRVIALTTSTILPEAAPGDSCAAQFPGI